MLTFLNIFKQIVIFSIGFTKLLMIIMRKFLKIKKIIINIRLFE